jgi:hypothetical protein
MLMKALLKVTTPPEYFVATFERQNIRAALL